MQSAATYEEAMERKYPEPLAIAIAKDPQGKYNPITLGWTMATSNQPPMLAISVGVTHYSIQAIRQSREFVVCFPSSLMVKEVLFHGTKSGRNVDKITDYGSQTQPAVAVDSLLFTNAVANFECKLISEHETGDHIIFIGQVVASHVNEDESIRRLYTLGKDYQLGGVVPE